MGVEAVETFNATASLQQIISVNESYPLVSDSQDDRQRGADSSHEASQRSSASDSRLSASKVT